MLSKYRCWIDAAVLKKDAEMCKKETKDFCDLNSSHFVPKTFSHRQFDLNLVRGSQKRVRNRKENLHKTFSVTLTFYPDFKSSWDYLQVTSTNHSKFNLNWCRSCQEWCGNAKKKKKKDFHQILSATLTSNPWRSTYRSHGIISPSFIQTCSMIVKLRWRIKKKILNKRSVTFNDWPQNQVIVQKRIIDLPADWHNDRPHQPSDIPACP